MNNNILEIAKKGSLLMRKARETVISDDDTIILAIAYSQNQINAKGVLAALASAGMTSLKSSNAVSFITGRAMQLARAGLLEIKRVKPKEL